MSTNPQTSYEIERGKPMPNRNHSLIQLRLGIVLGKNGYDDKFNLHSELDIILDDWKAVPDIAIYKRTPIDYQKDSVRIDEAPLCAIEILSAKQGMKEIIDKISTYFEKGVQSY